MKVESNLNCLLAGILILNQSGFCRSDPVRSGPVRSGPIRSDLGFANGHSHPGQSFLLSLCGPISIHRANAHMVHMG